ncbi:MAG: ATP-binding protein, partial [Nostoc sp.]
RGGEHVDLIEEEIRPLIALLAVYQKRRNYKLTEEEIFDIISKNRITFDNLLVREILSNPSGNIPIPNDEDEDIGTIGTLINPQSSVNEIENSDELSELFS